MKKSFFVFAMLLAGQAFSQGDINWKTPVEGKSKSIYFHQFTQTPIVETSSSYYGVNPTSKSVVWTIKKSEKMAALQAAGTASALTGSSDMTKGLDMQEYFDIPYTQFASISNNLIDVSTGKIVLGEGNNPYKSYLAGDLIPELNLLLVKVKDEDGSQKVHAIDIATSQVVWTTKLAEASAAKDAMKYLAKAQGLDAFSVDLFKPAATASGDIIYNNNGKLALLNGKTGAIAWENDCNPGTFFLNQNQTVILVVDKRSTASNMLSLSGTKPFGKKVIAVDAATGKNLWSQPVILDGTYKMYKLFDQNQVILANNDGLNIYDIATGEKVWKKDFDAPRLKSMAFLPEGLEVQFANKMMAVDLKTGKKAWKKFVELEDVDEKDAWGAYAKLFKNTRVMISKRALNVYDKESGDRKWGMLLGEGDRLTFDDANGKIIVIGEKRVHILDPDNQKKRPKAVDFKIENPEEIAGCDFRHDGYFIYGQKEYALITKDGQLVEHKVYKQLVGDRLKKAGLLTASIASGLLSARVSSVNSKGETTSTSGVFMDAESAQQMGAASEAQEQMRQSVKANDKKRRAVRTDNNYAYFMKGDSSNGTVTITLVIVEKNTGKEIKNVDFSSNRDVVYEIDSSNGMLYFLDNGEFNTMNI
ncbi:PQQ-binding-like beta-propeller repeat protein [uncultured Acetobacteroides sp.]|uniref:outer membrane protein assembly factor BamB family protein n=1 Tax=uncultured Acetobacteroides sp. TaxID=1760811 RepID=UPI0029F4740C|nr:PQQ-binding-like beta-propeller repeat protein [uncultured Acetobacteroides sp.]